MKRLSLLLILVLLGTSCSLTQKKCNAYFDVAKKEQYDIIVVPGTPYHGQPLDRILKGRILWSKFLIDEGIAKRVMYSGSSVYTAYYEAEIMALYAKEVGIPDSLIYIEKRAEHSTENAYYSYKKAKNLGFEKIALATDPFQTNMISDFIEEEIEGDMTLIPFVFDTMQTLESKTTNPSFNPSSAFNPNFVSIKDRESVSKRWDGTKGKNINDDFYKNGALD